MFNPHILKTCKECELSYSIPIPDNQKEDLCPACDLNRNYKEFKCNTCKNAVWKFIHDEDSGVYTLTVFVVCKLTNIIVVPHKHFACKNYENSHNPFIQDKNSVYRK